MPTPSEINLTAIPEEISLPGILHTNLESTLSEEGLDLISSSLSFSSSSPSSLSSANSVRANTIPQVKAGKCCLIL